jgi:hypothetical protein
LRTFKATGRLTIRLAYLQLLKESEFDIELQEGDSLTIPPKNDVVNVTGSVMADGVFLYSDKYSPADYIQMAGGYGKYADTSNVFILKADGSARRLSNGSINWNPFRSRWELTVFGEKLKEIEPGDSIIIPQEAERIAWLSNIKDVTQILMQIAVVTGVLLKLY